MHGDCPRALYCHGNEPSHHTIYFFTLAGRPDLTAKYVNGVCDSFYRPESEGLCGNDDCGQMSAWYVFSCLGFYPFNPCGGEYVTVKPRFSRAVIRVLGRKPYAIDAAHVPGNGEPVVTHAEIVRGTPFYRSAILTTSVGFSMRQTVVRE